nr:histone-lysine N-methyltransferase ATX4-like [Ipomoea batatas]
MPRSHFSNYGRGHASATNTSASGAEPRRASAIRAEIAPRPELPRPRRGLALRLWWPRLSSATSAMIAEAVLHHDFRTPASTDVCMNSNATIGAMDATTAEYHEQSVKLKDSLLPLEQWMLQIEEYHEQSVVPTKSVKRPSLKVRKQKLLTFLQEKFDPCQIAVHQECCGARNVRNITSWVCRACETPDIERECCLCPVKGGALKPTDVAPLWVHVTDAWFQPEVTEAAEANRCLSYTSAIAEAILGHGSRTCSAVLDPIRRFVFKRDGDLVPWSLDVVGVVLTIRVLGERFDGELCYWFGIFLVAWGLYELTSPIFYLVKWDFEISICFVVLNYPVRMLVHFRRSHTLFSSGDCSSDVLQRWGLVVGGCVEEGVEASPLLLPWLIQTDDARDKSIFDPGMVQG